MTIADNADSSPPSPSASFAELGLLPLLCDAAEKAGFKRPTAIQQAAIPPLLAGRDVLVPSQTGSGKTAAFVLPALQLLALSQQKSQDQKSQGQKAGESAERPRLPRVLILEPTRDLATQTASLCRQLGRQLPLRTRVICGGMDRAQQCRTLAEGVDIVVGTHGRLLDLAQEGRLYLEDIEYLVLDEADRLLDEEFSESMTALARYLPDHPQTVFCSATLPAPMETFARKVTRNPVRMDIPEETITPKRLRQRALFLQEDEKPAMLERIFRDLTPEGRCIVFVRTKKDADTLGRALRREKLDAMVLHGGLPQGERKSVLNRFKEAPQGILVTTDIAARGLDIDDVTLVVNADMPATPELYIHRIGRTARAGQKGRTLSLVTPDERTLLRDVEQHIQHRIRIVTPEALDR